MVATAPSTTPTPKRPRRPRTTRRRDMGRVLWLRVAEVHEVYGIGQHMLHHYATCDGERRLPSVMIAGTRGRRGVRLFRRDELEQWLERWRQTPNITTTNPRQLCSTTSA